ncbi:Pre-rRNA-processing protein TSR2 [Phlyctema vagabunda]|uniref:Pre-rRNA-processing protein TSR2 n=1 Tax=Phlyctema vagabunda TaxID=108571 RepID=A0ABR4PFD3_9HELO
MASATQLDGSAMDLGENPVTGPLPAPAQAQFEFGVSLLLNFWPALSLAVSSNWGAGDGATASDKRDWFAGAVVELFDERPDTDLEDVETVLLQVMLDEFEVAVDDDSAYDVAMEIIRIRTQCAKADYTEVERLRQRWESSKGKATSSGMFKDAGELDNETDGSEEDDSDDDMEMDEAPQLVQRVEKVKAAPEVDDEGFTKVTKKR